MSKSLRDQLKPLTGKPSTATIFYSGSCQPTLHHLKRTYHRVASWALKDYLRLMHGKKIRKAQKPLRKLRRYLGKLLKTLDPHLETCPQQLFCDMAIRAKLPLQNREGKNKIYSCHEPQVSCIAKGKAHKSYEFGSKACLVVIEKK